MLSFDPKLPVTLPSGWTAKGYSSYVYITAPTSSRVGEAVLTVSEHMRNFAFGNHVLTRNGEKYQGRGWKKRLYDDAITALLAAGAIASPEADHMQTPALLSPSGITPDPMKRASSRPDGAIQASSGPVKLLAQPVYAIDLAMPGEARDGHHLLLTRAQIVDLAAALLQVASVLSNATAEEAKTLGYTTPVKAQSGPVEVFATLDDDRRGEMPDYFLTYGFGDNTYSEFIGLDAAAVLGLANSVEQLRLAII